MCAKGNSNRASSVSGVFVHVKVHPDRLKNVAAHDPEGKVLGIIGMGGSERPLSKRIEEDSSKGSFCTQLGLHSRVEHKASL